MPVISATEGFGVDDETLMVANDAFAKVCLQDVTIELANMVLKENVEAANCEAATENCIERRVAR